MELVSPALTLEATFSQFYEDFALNDAENSEYYLEGKINFPRYIKRLIDESKGLNLREGYVPCSHFWLIDSENTILGVIRVRHNINNEFLSMEAGHIGYDIAPSYRRKGYGKMMLKMALPKANTLGITKALLTADEDNVASRKVIEANGGKFEKIIMGKVFDVPIARYWINCN